MRFARALSTMSFLRKRRQRLRFLLIIPCWSPPLERRMRPLPLTRKRLDAALLVFIFGMSSLARSREAALPVGEPFPALGMRGPRISADGRTEVKPGSRPLAATHAAAI